MVLFVTCWCCLLLVLLLVGAVCYLLLYHGAVCYFTLLAEYSIPSGSGTEPELDEDGQPIEDGDKPPLPTLATG
jgi:hypothetical protein